MQLNVNNAQAQMIANNATHRTLGFLIRNNVLQVLVVRINTLVHPLDAVQAVLLDVLLVRIMIALVANMDTIKVGLLVLLVVLIARNVLTKIPVRLVIQDTQLMLIMLVYQLLALLLDNTLILKM